MRVITDNKITAIVASSEDSSYPDSNLLDEHPKRKWKALSTASTATLTVTVEGKCDALALVGITADTAVVSISDPNGVAFESGTVWESGTSWATTPEDIETEIEWVQEQNTSLWIDFDQFDSIVDISVTLYSNPYSAETISAGVMYAGEKETFKNPKYGLSFGSYDYSTVRVLSNGATYTKKRDVVRTVSGVFSGTLEKNSLFLSIQRTYGKAPLMWSFIDDVDGVQHIMYARFQDQANSSLNYLAHGETTFNFIEVL